MVQQLFPDHGHEQLHICRQCQQYTARGSWPATGKASVHYKKVPASTGRISRSGNQTVLNQTTTEQKLHCTRLIFLMDFILGISFFI